MDCHEPLELVVDKSLPMPDTHTLPVVDSTRGAYQSNAYLVTEMKLL